MNKTIITTIYFRTPGRDNTAAALEIARRRADELPVRSVIVASSTGATGVQAARLFQGYNLIVVSTSTGFTAPNTQRMNDENRQTIERLGGRILTHQHSFGGVGRAVRRKLDTHEVDEIMAYTLRIFGHGTKVACEIALMAADAGLVRAGEPAISIGGTGKGADTALLLAPANAQDWLDLQVMEILCKPGFPQPGTHPSTG